MRSHGVVLVLLVHGCGSSKSDESKSKADLAKADELERSLDPKFLDIVFAPDPKSAAGFPPLEAQAKCGSDVVKVSYDPYRDLVNVAFSREPSLDAQTRTLTFNGARVWADKRPFKSDGMMYQVRNADGTMADTSSRSSGWLENVSTKHAKMFPPGTDAQIDVGGTAMIATEVSSTEFKWTPVTFKGWRVKLHVFSRDMAKQMTDHKAAAQRANKEVQELSRHTQVVESLRKSKHEKAVAVVKRFDELMAAANKKQADTKTVPFAEHIDSLKVEKPQTCAN